jgi:hypothetical protein
MLLRDKIRVSGNSGVRHEIYMKLSDQATGDIVRFCVRPKTLVGNRARQHSKQQVASLPLGSLKAGI